jgi:bidirectional [NiFe] hydrogenase diaphorase subunit
VEEIGGGTPDGRPVKAVQTGGPSGGCIPAELFDTPVDYESLTQLGSIMGSGGMIVMDDDNNMVDVARFYMEFCMDESCGKCVPCRVGTVQMHRLLTKILAGEAGPADLARLKTLCDMVRHTNLCGLGQTAPNPVLSTLRYFRHEYEALLQKGPTTHAKRVCRMRLSEVAVVAKPQAATQTRTNRWQSSP